MRVGEEIGNSIAGKVALSPQDKANEINISQTNLRCSDEDFEKNHFWKLRTQNNS
jgi:hypothetical protein